MLFSKLKRWYHRWCLRNAIAKHDYRICVYHASTDSFTVESPRTGWKYHVYVDSNGNIVFKGLEYA